MASQQKVKYLGCSEEQMRWGNNDDPRKLLVPGQIYKVENCEIHNWNTKYKLAGIDGKFNSVCFEGYNED